MRRVVTLVSTAALIGLILGVAFSGDEVVSMAVWVGAALATVVAFTVWKLLAVAGVEPASMTPAWRAKSQRRRGTRDPALRATRAAVSGSLVYAHTFETQLRPRLVAIAKHHLPVRHGIEAEPDSPQVSSLLGDTAWLIDAKVTKRTPSTDEIDRFLTVVVGDRERLS